MASPAQSLLKVLILPNDVSSNGRICTLAHPRTTNPSRYYFSPEKGVFEFTRIAAPKSICQSWLLGPRRKPIPYPEETNSNGSSTRDSSHSQSLITEQTEERNGTCSPIFDGYIAKVPELLVATPIDPLFLMLPSFCTPSQSTKPTSQDKLFLSSEDLFEKLEIKSKHLDLLSQNDRMRRILEERMNAVCDIVKGGGEDMYRLNQNKLLNELISKAEKAAASGLPLSMEDKLVRDVLEEPMIGLKRNESSFSESANPSQAESVGPEPSSLGGPESQPSMSFSNTLVSEISSENQPTTSTQPDPSQNIKALLRLRTVLSYMISTYLPPPLEAEIRLLLASSATPVDFKPLDEHLTHLRRLQAEDAASRSLSNFSRKRSRNEEDDDAAESRAEKKKQKEEEEKRRKAGESRGVRDLKKVDTSGMKKMSDFFGKSAATKKK